MELAKPPTRTGACKPNEQRTVDLRSDLSCNSKCTPSFSFILFLVNGCGQLMEPNEQRTVDAVAQDRISPVPGGEGQAFRLFFFG